MKSSIESAMKAGRIIDEEKFISECCLNFGAGRRYVLEYLKDLENEGFIIIKDDQIWTPAALEAERILNSEPKFENNTQGGPQ